MTTATCTHRWLLKEGNSAWGRCLLCGVERVHTGGMPVDREFGFMGPSAHVREKKEPKPKKTEFNHGTTGYSNHGCRCEVCVVAHNESNKRWYRERAARDRANFKEAV